MSRIRFAIIFIPCDCSQLLTQKFKYPKDAFYFGKVEMLLVLQMAIKEKICHLQFEAEVARFA